MKYRSKVVEIEAIQWNGAGFDLGSLPQWLYEAAVKKERTAPGAVLRDGPVLHINTPEGTMTAQPDDWIICGTEGELYPCKPSVFARKYEPVE